MRPAMSSFKQLTKHPQTGEMQMAEWLDDYFGRHRYGVRFPDGNVYQEHEIEEAKRKSKQTKRRKDE